MNLPFFFVSCRLLQQIIDAILAVDIDDPPCAIAAGALLFVLASDVSTSISVYIRDAAFQIFTYIKYLFYLEIA